VDFKPSDFSLTSRDLLSIMVPGAVLSFSLTPAYPLFFGPQQLFPDPVGEAGSIAVFLVAAYVLGHLLDAAASALLDPVYDRTYRNLKRLPLDEKSEAEKSTPQPGRPFRTIRELFRQARKRLRLTRKRLPIAWDLQPKEAKDPLRDAAHSVHTAFLKEKGLDALADTDTPNSYEWAQSAIVLRARDGAREVEALQAASKFFRSMSIVVVLVPLFGLLRAPFLPARDVSKTLSLMLVALVVAAIAAMALAHRFMKLRWTATQRTYEYYVVSLPAGPLPNKH
jgi:hypothetical protein